MPEFDSEEGRSFIIKPVIEGHRYRCPCCHYRTLRGRGGYEICHVCFWEDDGQDDHDADKVYGGPNRDVSLIEARQNYQRLGVADPRDLGKVRPPTAEESEPN